MSDRWCDDCAWPEECAAEACCRRREAGEVRSAAPSEVADVIARTCRPKGAMVVSGAPSVSTALQAVATQATRRAS